MTSVTDLVKRYYTTVDAGDPVATSALFAADASYDRPGYPTMVGQQISVAAARTALSALTDALGERVAGFGDDAPPSDEGAGARFDRLFPTMAAIAAHGHEVLRGPGARIRAVVNAATALADGTLSLTAGDETREQRAALLALPGVGPWTADYVRMRVLGDPDITLPGDVAVRAGAASAGIPADPRGFDRWAARTAPWRSYLTAHLWRAVPPRERTTR